MRGDIGCEEEPTPKIMRGRIARRMQRLVRQEVKTMAHECPDCGCLCFCNGDIDDLCLNEPHAVNRCTHCPEEETDLPAYDEDEYGFVPNNSITGGL